MIPGARPRLLTGDRRILAGAVLTLFGMSAAHALLETARDALFLARLPAAQLPWAYLAIAVAAAGLARLPMPGGRAPGRRTLSAMLLAAAAITAAFWATGTANRPWLLRGLYVWTGVNATLTGLQFWYVAGSLWTVTQAKRAYRWVVFGGLLGSVAGAAFARALASAGPAERLLLASAAVLALTALAPALVLTTAEHAAPRPRLDLGASVRLLRRAPYLRGLASIALLSTLAFTAADFVFKSAVARAVPPAQLGWFFATFYTVMNALALLTQLVAAGWLLRLGLPRAQAALPVLLALAFGGVAAGLGVLAAVLLKLVDGSLREAHRTTSELLLVPAPDDQRSRVKPFLDVVVRRGGQALASVAILAVTGLPRAEAWVAVAGAALCVAWVAQTIALGRPYLELFRDALRERRLPEPSELPPLDLGALEALFAALGSRDDGEVIAALDVLAEQGRARLIPPFVLYHPSEAVALRALAIFEQARLPDLAAAAGHLLGHANPRLRAAAVEARAQGAGSEPEDREIFRAAARDPSPLVRAAAVVGLGALGESTPETERALEALMASPEPEARTALARAIAHRPSARLEGLLSRLASAEDPDVLAEVARAVGALRGERFLPVLLGLLARHEVRPAAREAFLAYGESGLAFLEGALGDARLPHEIRRHVPRTISRFPPERAAGILLARLLEEPDGTVRFKILRGLGRIVADDPRVALDRVLLRRTTEATLEAALRLLRWRLVLEQGARDDPRRATQVHELLAALLRDKERHAIDRLFRLLALRPRLRGEHLERVHRGLRSADPKLRASSRELLEALLRPPLRRPVLALVDEAPDAERLARAGGHHGAPPLDYPGLLAVLLDAPGDTLRSLAVHHAGELGYVTLRDRIERVRRESPTPFLERAAARALRELPVSGGGART